MEERKEQRMQNKIQRERETVAKKLAQQEAKEAKQLQKEV
jgi:hypothetical protein